MGSNEYKKGLWTVEEDRILMEYIKVHGKGRWNRVAEMTGLKRCGRSCRLRWMNYLSPSVKHGKFSEEEEDLIIRLHNLLGNRWSLIAGRVPGRTDNQVKNHWNTHLSKRVGVKKANATSSLSHATEGGGGGNSTSTPPSNGGNHVVESHQMARVGCGPQEQSLSDAGVNSRWFADNELLNWTAPTLMDLLDGSPLYVPWDEF